MTMPKGCIRSAVPGGDILEKMFKARYFSAVLENEYPAAGLCSN
jgi:hypothetical protein